jgi:hypothetical protein
MNPGFQQRCGTALIAFTLLIAFTIVLHPTGGNIPYLIKIAPHIILAHSLALLSLPFAAIGFWGLTRRIGSDNFLAISAFVICCFGLVAVMFAGTTNGLIMPIFITRYQDAGPATLDALKPLISYTHAVNTAYDYIYTVALCLAIFCWSVAILRTGAFPRWTAWLGLTIPVIGGVGVLTASSPASLLGLQIFVLCLISWTIAIGMIMRRS